LASRMEDGRWSTSMLEKNNANQAMHQQPVAET